MEQGITRRHMGKQALAGLGALILAGCPSPSGLISGDGTGVRGLNTPDEILSNPKVADIVGDVRNLGYSMNLERGVNPPIIAGSYSISGQRFFPGPITLASGTFTWSNQTFDNHIDTNYNQLIVGGGQSGVSSLGEIIRGEGNRFTVYSILRVRDTSAGCDEEVVFLVDGVRHGSGDVSALYIGAPIENTQCLLPSAGSYELSLVLPLKEIVSGGDEGYASLMGTTSEH